MRLAGFLGCILVVAPLGLGAQNSGYGVAGMEGLSSPDGKTVVTTPGPATPNLCPVSVVASHLSDGSMVRTRANHPSGTGQRLHLKLTSPDERTIDSVTVNLWGWTAAGRAARVSAGKDSALKMQTLTVYLKPGTDHTATVDVWAPGLTAVISVELVSVKFFDGSTWTPPEGKSCRVTPDLLMAVSR